MCLGVPGQVLEISPDPLGLPMGRVSFGGAVREVCLAYVPEAGVGDWVLVHVGFALSRLDEAEARETLEIFRQLEISQDSGEGSDPGAEAAPRATGVP